MLFSKCTRAVGRRLNAVRNISASFSPACSTNSTKMDAGEMTSSTYYDGDDIPADQQRLVRAAVLGVPNAGKSTLVNQLVGKKLFAVSPKRHTTTRSVAGVFSMDSAQVILMDTPGVVPYQIGRKLRAPKSFLTGPQRSLMGADLVIVMVDAADKRRRDQLDDELIKTLALHPHIPSILLLNKVDAVKHKHVLLQITESINETTKSRIAEERQKKARHCSSSETTISTSNQSSFSSGAETENSTESSDNDRGEPLANELNCLFREVFMVSALTGDGVEDLREYLLSCCRPGLWEYSPSEQSDQTPLELVEDIVREKFFLHLHREIPYLLTQSNLVWEKEEETQIIYQNITCRSSNQASIIIGPGGRTIQTITAEAQSDIEALLGCPVDLTLNIRSQK